MLPQALPSKINFLPPIGALQVFPSLVPPHVLPSNINHLPPTKAPQFFPSIEAPIVLPSLEIPHVLPSSIALQEVEEMALDPKPNLDH
jgi:hypothetical protein